MRMSAARKLKCVVPLVAACAAVLLIVAPAVSRAQTDTTGTAEVVRVVSVATGQRLQVGGRDFMVKGMNWDYTPIGQNYAYDLWQQSDDMIIAALDREMSLLALMAVAVHVGPGMTPATEHVFERIAACRLRRRTLLRSGINVDCGFGCFGGRSKELSTLRSQVPARRFLVVRMNIARFHSDFVDEEAKTRSALVGECVSFRAEDCLKRAVDVTHLGNTATLCNRPQCDADLIIAGESGVGAFNWLESGHQ